MNPWVAVLRALPLTCIVYACTTALGALHALPAGLELQRLATLPLSRGSAAIARVESLLALLSTGRALCLTLLLSLLAFALVTPWLQMSWFTALSEPTNPGSALAQGARLFVRAILTSLWVGLGSLFILAPFPMLAWLIRGWLETHAHARVQDLATLLFLAPGLISLCIALTWHDLARAHCLSHGAFASARLSLRAAFNPRYLSSFMAWSVASLLLFGMAQWLALAASGSGAPGVISAAMLQGVAVTRCVLRSRWLTQALMAADATQTRRK